jgi:hypothetical protein
VVGGVRVLHKRGLATNNLKEEMSARITQHAPKPGSDGGRDDESTTFSFVIVELFFSRVRNLWQHY